MQRLGLVLFALLCAVASASATEATFSLPLKGYYRPGRYMPLQLSAKTDSPADRFTLRAAGALTTEIDPSAGHIDGVIPWLAIRTIREVKWASAGIEHPIELPLHPLEAGERLIGYAGADPDALAPLLAGQKLIRVELDVTNPLPGEITAWESLDGIVLDAAAARRMNEAAVRNLLAGGTAIAIRSPQKPGGGWAWEQRGSYWIARADIAGPTSAFVPEDAYGPAENWLRGWPWEFRKRMILAAVVLLILTTAATLWRSRRAVLLVVTISVAATAGIAYWRHRQSPAIEASGSVIVVTDTTTQRDQWTYRATLRDIGGSFDFATLARPVFATRQQPDDMQATLLCNATGSPLAFRYELKEGQSIAFQTRYLHPGRQSVSPQTPITSAMRTVADRLYAMKGDVLVGQVDEATEFHWPDVVVQRAAGAGIIAREPTSKP